MEGIAAGRTLARTLVLFGLQAGGEGSIGFDGIAGLVWVRLVVGGIARAATRVAWRRAGRATIVGGGIDGFGGLLPLGFLSVDVDVEPKVRS